MSTLTGISNNVMDLKFSKLQEYIETLEKKLEKRDQSPDTNDLPSGHRSPDNSFTAVQKSQVNLHPAPVMSYPNNQQNKKT